MDIVGEMAVSQPPPHAADVVDDPGLLERGALLDVIAAAAAAVGAGEGRFVAISGSAGLGKTRVVAAAKRLAAASGLRVLAARGAELEQEYGFGVARQLFEQALERMEPAQRAAALSGAAAAAEPVIGTADPDRLPTGDFASLHGLFWLTANLSQERPLALVCDDVHWADESSLRFLAYLLPRLEGLAVLVVVALRPGTHPRPLDLITLDHNCRLLTISLLSTDASTELLRTTLPDGADGSFVAACVAAAGGNPLLLRELAETVRLRRIAATAANADRVAELGADAVGRRVALWLRRLPAASTRLAQAVAVLGGEAAPASAAALAGLTPPHAEEAITDLERGGILRRRLPDPNLVEFAHPLIRAAIYDGIGLAGQADWHRRAARTLAAAGAAAEHVATHLLRTPPEGEPAVADTLRRAANDALGRGAPDAALSYLQRCAAEPTLGPARMTVLTEAGTVAALVDLPAAADYLREAIRLAADPRERADLAYLLGRVLSYLGRPAEALDLVREALTWVPASATELDRRLRAAHLNMELFFVAAGDAERQRTVGRLRELDPHASLGGRMLDCVIALYDGLLGDPAAVAPAVRGIADGLLVRLANGDAVLHGAWGTLLAADREEAMISLDAAVAQAHEHGSAYALSGTLTFRGLGWLWRGQLAEAVTDLREAVRTAELTGIDVARPFVGPFLADALTERGDLDAADAALSWVRVPAPLPPSGPWYLHFDSVAGLRYAQRRPAEALESALTAGHYFAVHGFGNPAYLAWRTRAALCLHALGRTDEGSSLAVDEVQLARRWGAPRALGHALRITGLLTPGPAGRTMLEEAVDVLGPSPARLEYAKSLCDLGGALRRLGHRTEARRHLAQALDLARHCGAGRLADVARAELRAAGARPRQSTQSGPPALTVSEQRVAALAADGHSNRDIAQALFVTPKTVEVHLSSVYRKLDVRNRVEMTVAMKRATA
jgi:DNA-binding CsgD family transcriptional regulator